MEEGQKYLPHKVQSLCKGTPLTLHEALSLHEWRPFQPIHEGLSLHEWRPKIISRSGKWSEQSIIFTISHQRQAITFSIYLLINDIHKYKMLFCN